MLDALQNIKYAQLGNLSLDTFSLGTHLNREHWDGLDMDIKHKINCFTYLGST